MKNYNIEIITPIKLAPVVADEIVAAINDSIEEKGICNLVLAGGKTPGGIYRLLSKPPRVSQVDWSKVRLFWGDDRYVSKDDNASNYKLVKETLLSDINIPEANIIAFDTSFSTSQESATEYHNRIKKVFNINSVDELRFDVTLLGIGEDGHTASIFPNSTLINENEKIACASISPAAPKDRVTLSPKALFNSKNIYFIVKGDNKAKILDRILNSEESVQTIPAKLYEKASGKVTWFIDSEAGKFL